MKKMMMILIAAFSTTAVAHAQAPKMVAKCVENTRSMTIYKSVNGTMKGRFIGFDLATNKLLASMACGVIQGTHTYKCTSKIDYYVIMFKGANRKWTVQLNLTGDFGADSGYLYSLSCE